MNEFHKKVHTSYHFGQYNRQKFMIGTRATLHPHPSHSSLSEFTNCDEQKPSNVQQLKQEIRNLQNSQFLCMKYRNHTESQIKQSTFATTSQGFMPRKKVNQYQKFKLFLKRKGKERRISMLLDCPYQFKPQNIYLNSLKIKDINIPIQELKKKETPSIIKKFYRPNSSSNRSKEIHLKENQIRGKSMRNSKSLQKEKENILICCF